ncbi:sulfotransferase family protein [Candidatus Poribacteria bacterium]|nr:sulfotransferase family protein [Candidatus Poribacteria bacterium]
MNTCTNELITVVSGLPRSGTSMLMQMLDAAGYPCLTDGVRRADADNPRGYFEYEKVKQLRRDCAWLPEAKGKAVKIIVQLIPFLPLQFSYQVIFMERDISEVLASQREMLQRQGKDGGNLSDAQLHPIFERQVLEVKRLLSQRNIPMLDVAYSDALQYPMKIAEQIREFLSEDLDVCAMAAAIDPNLHRQRCGQ